MAAKPTAVQEAAIRTAIDTNRVGSATAYAGRTLGIMERNGWITRPNPSTYRITPEAVRALGLYTLADRYRNDDLLSNDPKAQRQADVVAMAEAAGIYTSVTVGATETIRIPVEHLARLLAAYRTAPTTM